MAVFFRHMQDKCRLSNNLYFLSHGLSRLASTWFRELENGTEVYMFVSTWPPVHQLGIQ